LSWKSHCSPYHPVSWSSDQSVSLSFHCFENLTVLHAFQLHDPVIRVFHCLFIVLKILLFSMPSSHALFWVIFLIDLQSKLFQF
jgi:hypothetical protein